MRTDDIRNALPLGYKLNDEFVLEGILGHGGFGITYLARDIALDRQVAIKEYLPQMCALREGHTSIVPKSNSDEEQYLWGLDRFQQEGRILAGFKHPNIVSVLRLITDVNNTAYLVMSYEEGQSLGKYLEQHGPTLPEATLKRIFLPILDGLREVHKHQLLHRDIKPDNIYLRNDQSPMLLDFGSARYALGEHNHSLSVVISPGYFPPEQLSSRGNQGEWTDVYGVGACFYTCMTGKPPVSADDRSLARNQDEEDPYVPISQKVRAGQYSNGLLACVDAALQFKAKERPQTIREFQQVLMGDEQKVEEKESVENKQKYFSESISQTFYRRVGLSLIVVALIIYVFYSPNNSISECDRLAASSKDNDRVSAAVDGGADFNAELAISACREAIAVAPISSQELHRSQFQYARSLIVYEKCEANPEAFITKTNCREAKKWLLEAANGGYVVAQVAMGAIGVVACGQYDEERLCIEAEKWFRKAAKQGDSFAQYLLGSMYHEGAGLSQSDDEAVKWYRKAAEQGNTDALEELANIALDN